MPEKTTAPFGSTVDDWGAAGGCEGCDACGFDCRRCCVSEKQRRHGRHASKDTTGRACCVQPPEEAESSGRSGRIVSRFVGMQDSTRWVSEGCETILGDLVLRNLTVSGPLPNLTRAIRLSP